MKPRLISSWSQRPRFCSGSGTGSPSGIEPGRQARRLDLHQRDQAVYLGFGRHQLGEHAAEAQRFAA